MLSVEGWTGGAEISDCGRYRFSLSREWQDGEGTVLFVMLNPSTADASLNDPTIRRCIGFARSWGAKRLEIRNLFAFRATDPRDLEKAHASGVNVIGPGNFGQIVEAADEARAKTVIVAWGAHKMAKDCGNLLVREIKRSVSCLGTTKAGTPKHPLYVRSDVELVDYR